MLGGQLDYICIELKWEDPLLILIFEERHTFNPDLLRWGDPPLLWATPSAGLEVGSRVESTPVRSHN